MNKPTYQSRFTSGNLPEICKRTGINNKGQAMIEYVLMLIITISLIVALASQIFKPLEKFMQAFMGEYVKCLLETGALPSFGGEGLTSAEDMGCTMAKFNDVAGSGGSKNGKGGGGSSASGGSDSQSGSDKSSSSSGGDSEGSSSRSSSSYAGSASRGGRSIMRPSNRGSTGVESAASNGKVVEIAFDGQGGGGFFKTTSNGRFTDARPKKTMAVGISGLTEADKKKIEKKREKSISRTIATGEFGAPIKKLGVKKPEIKSQTLDDSEPMTIGNFIRYLFIAALIIALVVFIGGQALSISSGGDN